MPESFTSEELAGLRRRYRTQVDAVHLLDRAGFPEDHIPTFTTASVFWHDINTQLSNGRMPGGRDTILAQALRDYPGFEASIMPPVQGLPSTMQNSSLSTLPGASPQVSPPQAEPPGSKTQLWVAVIGGLVTIIVAAITIIPSLMGNSDAKSEDSPKPSTSSSNDAKTEASPSSSTTPRKVPSLNVDPHWRLQEVSITPTSGPAQTTNIKVHATGFLPNEEVKIEFDRGSGLTNFDGPYGSEKNWYADKNGVVSEELPIPDEVCCAGGKLFVRITSISRHSEASDQTTFTLT